MRWSIAVAVVHDRVSEFEEALVIERLREEIRQVGVRAYEGDHELHVFDALAHEVMPALDMLHA